MEPYYLYVGLWNQVYTDENHREIVRIVAEKIGEWEAKYGEFRGMTYQAFRTEANTIIIHQYLWSRRWDGDHRSAIFEYASLEEAEEDGFRNVIENMRKYGK